jgi:hypothetical protein
MAYIPRCTIQEYLNQGPFQGLNLSKAMGDLFCLCGSQCLDFFMDTSDGFKQELKKSDYDFNTDGTVKSLEATIDRLKGLGVRFESIFDNLREKISERKFEVHEREVKRSDQEFVHLNLGRLRMLHDHWLKMKRRCDYSDVNEFFSALERQTVILDPHRPVGNAQDEHYHLKLSGEMVVPINIYDSKFESEDWDGDRSYHGLNLTVVSGKIGESVKVQVIAKPGQPIEQIIMEYHSSNVQAAIFENMAYHLNYTITQEGKAYSWEKNTQAPKSAAQARDKYTKRGFTYVGYPSEKLSECDASRNRFRGRSLEDDESFALTTGGLDLDSTATTTLPLSLRWREYRDSTKLLNKRMVDRTKVDPGWNFWNHVDSRPYKQFIVSRKM